MAVRFRKSKKVAPGTRINLGGRSAGISFGNRGGGVSFNSRTGARVRASIPGTGVSFSGKLFGRKKRKTKMQKAGGAASLIVSALVVILICWIYPIAIPFFILGVVVIFAFALIVAKRKDAVDAPEAGDQAAADPAPRRIEISCPCSAKFQVNIKKPGGPMFFTCPTCGQKLRVDTSKMVK